MLGLPNSRKTVIEWLVISSVVNNDVVITMKTSYRTVVQRVNDVMKMQLNVTIVMIQSKVSSR